MATQPKRKKLEPLDWREMADSSALRGMTSFLDIPPEDIRKGHYPDLSIVVAKSPVDITSTPPTSSPVVVMTPVDITSPVNVMSRGDETSPKHETTPEYETSPVDMTSPADVIDPMDITSTEDDALTGYDVSLEDGTSPEHETSPVDITSPVYSAQRSLRIALGKVPTQNRKIVRCRVAQDGHTTSEESVYQILWKRTTPENRTVRMGYREIADQARLSRKTVSRIIAALEEKLAIDLLEKHHSGDLIPKLYRVFSYKEILDRRKERGLEYIVRGPGVVFVTVQGEILELGKGREVTQVSSTMDIKSPVDDTYPVDITSIAKELNLYWIVDEAAVQKLLQDCLAIRPDATTSEILYFIVEKREFIRFNRNIHNPTGFLLSAVPQCLAGQTFEAFRQRRAEALRIEQEEQKRKDEDLIQLFELMKQACRRVLDDPRASESARRKAELELIDYERKQQQAREGK